MTVNMTVLSNGITGYVSSDPSVAFHGLTDEYQTPISMENFLKIYAGMEVKALQAIEPTPNFKCGTGVVYKCVFANGETGTLCQHQLVVGKTISQEGLVERTGRA
jgi:hypothetical protein